MSMIEKTFNDGEIIIKEGDTGNTFYYLLEGKVAVYKNYGEDDQVQIRILEEGQYFGEMAIIETYPRSTSVIADGDVKVQEIAAEELNEYFKDNPEKIVLIMKQLGKRLKEMTADYDEAKKMLTDLRSSGSSKKYEGFFMQMVKQSIFTYSKNARIEKPSAEALREAAEVVAQQDKDGNNVESYKKGTIIFKQGEVGKCMYIIHGGIVAVYSNYGQYGENKLTELYPVACFGEMGMVTEEARSATAVSESDETYVEIIRPDEIADLFKTCPAKVDMILKHLSYRLRSLTYDYFNACKEIYENSER